jgi:large subunit ribosomal protein L15
MARLESLRRSPGIKRRRKRVGRGPGSGHGKTAGRGHKGRKARSGGTTKAWFEGGQMPLQRRLPKRGFRPLEKLTYQVVNLRDLERLTGEEVTLEGLRAAGLIRSLRRPVKILGEGELGRALKVTAHAFSRSARAKIEKAGGEVREAD